MRTHRHNGKEQVGTVDLMATKKNKVITLNLRADRANNGQMSLTREDLVQLRTMRRTKGVERRDILKEFPQLDAKAYAVLTIKKINHMLQHQPFENTIWVAYNKKVK